MAEQNGKIAYDDGDVGYLDAQPPYSEEELRLWKEFLRRGGNFSEEEFYHCGLGGTTASEFCKLSS